MQIIPSPSNPTATQNEESASIGEARLALVDSISWLERLNANPDFARYLEFIRKGAEMVKRDAENISANDGLKRDAFAQRYFGLIAMAEWPKKNLDASQLALKALDEKSSKLQS
jgi:hypothetical protein